MNFLDLVALTYLLYLYNMDEILPFITETPHNLMAAAEGKYYLLSFFSEEMMNS